ncbi:VOC family protein [Catellatospora citrea]|uniref:Glyoxalase n=1 Tax=Catellatospora citrea TaxID=53366 RepID=A0A8J3KL76_9ACTN|nr:VOC family protein [Catellatospora citrea]RKE10121.1 putative enzyme related to lactoylglutathione lyase [Catellatospora citrea]GIF97969.1 glyoxalase [Catellatospora citrea]
MTSLIRHLTVDCTDPYTLAGFWSEVTGYPRDPDDKPEDPAALLMSPDDGPGLLFIAVPEGKAVKNRVHFDLQPTDRSRDEEIERLLAVGATLVDDLRNPDGTGWAVMADPEGNEFCVERSAAERATAAV